LDGNYGRAIRGGMGCYFIVEAVEVRFGDALPEQPIAWLTDNGSPYMWPHAIVYSPDRARTDNHSLRSPQSNRTAEA
jgi:hypothetical protein